MSAGYTLQQLLSMPEPERPTSKLTAADQHALTASVAAVASSVPHPTARDRAGRASGVKARDAGLQRDGSKLTKSQARVQETLPVSCDADVVVADRLRIYTGRQAGLKGDDSDNTKPIINCVVAPGSHTALDCAAIPHRQSIHCLPPSGTPTAAGHDSLFGELDSSACWLPPIDAQSFITTSLRLSDLEPQWCSQPPIRTHPESWSPYPADHMSGYNSCDSPDSSTHTSCAIPDQRYLPMRFLCDQGAHGLASSLDHTSLGDDAECQDSLEPRTTSTISMARSGPDSSSAMDASTFGAFMAGHLPTRRAAVDHFDFCHPTAY